MYLGLLLLLAVILAVVVCWRVLLTLQVLIASGSVMAVCVVCTVMGPNLLVVYAMGKHHYLLTLHHLVLS